jgi:predicted permease
MRLYRALLHLYPASFRAEYGADLCALFALRRTQATNPLAVLALWLEAIADACSSAPPAHWDILRQDVAWAARSLRRSPAFTLTAILVAALGIGAATAAFTLADHVLLRPLPYADSARLVKIWEDDSTRGYTRMDPSPANYRDWKRLSHSFEGVEAWWDLAANLSQVGNPARLEGAGITAGLLPMLGIQPALGRAFTADDDRPGAPGTVLLSDALWRSRFGADPGVTGRTVILDSLPYTVIGVMPRDFCFPSRDAQIWISARFGEDDFSDRSNNYIRVLAKLRRGVTLGAAQSEMRAVAGAMERAWPKENEHIGARVITLREELSSRSRMLLTALLGAALCVLLIGCTNLANLLLARALARRKELAVRTAMGAGRERLVRQLLTESLLLAIGGGIAGILLAFAALPLLVRLVPNSLPIAETPVIDVRVLLCAACITVLTALGFGVFPALRAGSGDLTGLREGSRAGGAGGRKEGLRSALVIAEIAGSVILLVSSGLLIRALWRLQNVDPGFRSAGVLTLRTALPIPKYNKVADRARFYSHVLQEARRLPGVAEAAYISFIPLAMQGGIWPIKVSGRDPSGAPERAMLRYVTSGYFAALSIPLHLGRDVSEADTREAPFTAVVSESFARRYWPGENPLGRHFDFALSPRTIVGVVGDIRARGPERESEPQVYIPYQQVADGSIIGYVPKDLVLRTSAPPGTLLPALRRIIAAADPEQPVSNVRMLGDVVESETEPRAVQVRALTAFAAIAFLLAAVGIHGLLSFTVSSRSQEIGVRLALGAQRTNILGMILRDAARLSAAGILFGAAAAYLAGSSMRALLAGVDAADLPTFTAAIALCALMTLTGSLIPALRAIHIDPASAIRVE